MMNLDSLFAVETLTVGEKVTKKVVPVREAYFHESGFGIYSVELENGMLFTMKGSFPGSLTIGNTYEVKAVVERYRGETQLSVKSIKVARAEGRRAVISYLQTLKGLKSRAEVIYDTFGADTLDVLMNKPTLVSAKIKGVGAKKVKDWSHQLKEKMEDEELLLYLFGLGLTPNQVSVLTETYGKNNVRAVLEENPYRLIQDVSGYGFKKCDVIARSTGIEFDNPKRVRAGILQSLLSATHEGHTYLPKGMMTSRVDELLRVGSESIDHSLIDEGVEMLLMEDAISIDEEKIFLKRYDMWEQRIVLETLRLVKNKPWGKTSLDDIERSLDDYLRETGLELETQQRKAVLDFSAEEGGFFILNGSAGCGKTFTLKIILNVLGDIYRQNRKNFKVKVMAPTGKASKVASKATGMPCVTIHRGLEFNINGEFDRNASNPLEETIIVIDESSMLDTELAKDLLLAIDSGAKVIFMGDTKQLPSVGAGNVLKDLIESNVVKVVTLDVVKRQGKDSGIIDNANRIINGEMIVNHQSTGDAFVIPRNSDDDTLQTLIKSIHRLIEKGFDLGEIQVLSPQRKGKLGIYNLNRVLQAELNPNGKVSTIRNSQVPKEEEALFYRTGDKVIHIANDKEKTLYQKDSGRFIKLKDKGITNGECGVIESIETVSEWSDTDMRVNTFERMVVKYEDWYVYYDKKADIDMLDHAFALTIHKSQGSQWDAVLMPISSGHTHMLDNNLIYTGYTRARLFHATIGSLRAFQVGIKTQRSSSRYTGVAKRLVA